jgi:hypothetical protein
LTVEVWFARKRSFDMKKTKRDFTREEIAAFWDAELDGHERFSFFRQFYPEVRTSYEQLKKIILTRYDEFVLRGQVESWSEFSYGYALALKELAEFIDAIEINRYKAQYCSKKGS